ncbi:V-type ATP synthase subunit A [Sedimentisphaera salicampi]|uniref:V-type ATP synthase alpha chain n=1 Tax=Sedimentisphaera salicampi TaxID=1941349 RepID=A0A1W6LK14_9BACT|nr:V-type ATP synthase subunit A [Sedimentisphaera salicampi]ARN56117.1 V-type sodium ATPase catalytic subunit A [Sedimentisphaera salicampi]OXU15749.1 V-type sodium ATPase catalytic subunit A [Sedimentisphaera salicampi]
MTELGQGRVIKVAGPVVTAEGMTGAKMYDVVRVGEANLIGEIVELHAGRANVQVYEDTVGVGPGEPVVNTGSPLSVELGPGLITNIYDGIQRPLRDLYETEGAFIQRGNDTPGLDRETKWQFDASMNEGDDVSQGDIIGTVQESSLLEHKIMVPQGVSGKLESVSSGEYTVTDTVAQVKTESGKTVNITLMQECPVRSPRKSRQRLTPDRVMVSGQRVIDTFFPIGVGGTACVPGPFGTGKTVVQHQLAKWIDAEVVVYVGCGERGNEMTDVLTEFPELKDPKSGKPLMERVVLIANTSDMPVAAREASVYTGITIAEYFRDMGYKVALMADSTSRWAEAMREISTRLEEMPAEEGYPAYLGSRIASFYERAGRIQCLGSPDREGALSIIGAVSPPGGDLSDSVVQATLHVVKVFWSLQSSLAQQRHFPAIDWLTSYSFYKEYLGKSFDDEQVAEEMMEMINTFMSLLEKEAGLLEIVRLVGAEAISSADRVSLETAKTVREDFLHQNAFHSVDTYTSLEKQYEMLKTILHLHNVSLEAVNSGADIDEIVAAEVKEDIARSKYTPEDELDKFAQIRNKIDEQVGSLKKEQVNA